MPQPITHYLVAKYSLRNEAKELWKTQANFAGFGSFGADMFYLKDALEDVIVGKLNNLLPFINIDKLSYTPFSDIMHWEGSFGFFCEMLDYIKKKPQENRQVIDKLKAYTYGYYSHVVADCVFHPFVYRRSTDHWKYHDVHPAGSSVNPANAEKFYLVHKFLEKEIDSYLVNKLEGCDPFAFNYEERILCYEPDSNKMLDYEIFRMLLSAIKKVYEPVINRYLKTGSAHAYYDYFDSYSLNDKEHPIHEAYDDFVDTITELYTITLLRRIKHPQIQALTPVKSISAKQVQEDMNECKQVWYAVNNSLKYSVSELFQLSVKAMSRIVALSEKYFKTAGDSANNFFAANPAPFLGCDYNLDSGLPASFNNEPVNLSEIDSDRYGFKLNDLVLNYNAI